MSKGSDDWFDLPRPAQGIRLYQIREELREKNLARHRGAAARDLHVATGR